MINKIKIAVVTGSRADYGLLKPILKIINKDPVFELQLVVTGSHLLKRFGYTIKEILDDGFKVTTRIVTNNNKDNLDLLNNMGTLTKKFSKTFDNLKPNILLILGDRYEIFVAAQAAFILKVKIAHIHGGELTQGAVDDVFRHMITKMSHLHFVTNDDYKKRVIQLGEDPKRVFNFGAPAIESLKNFLEKRKLKNLDCKRTKKLFLITFHPETMSQNQNICATKNLLEALSFFEDTTMIFTYPNQDPDNTIIINLIEKFVKKSVSKRKIYKSLGQNAYWDLMIKADVVIGNSSSAIIEAPFLKIPTVNIGDRQTGRIKASSIIDTKVNTRSIRNGISTALTEEFRKKLNKTISFHGNGEVAKNIIKQLKKRLPIFNKKFYDIYHDKL